MAQLAEAVAAFHAAAEPRRDHGGSDAMRWVVDGNARGFAEFGALDPDVCARLTASSRRAVAAQAPLLNARRTRGLVRQCHGDLHLRNIVLLDGKPTLFDAIEFNDELACIDVWYDLAFLLMDLARRQLPQHANVVFNRYLFLTQDFEALSLLPLFQSCRAAIRAKTSATAASMQPQSERRRQLQQIAREYLAMAERLLQRASPRLIAIGGLSGTGKSSVAAALAAQIGSPPGAVVLRSDEVRKQLAGVPSTTRLGADGYSAAMSDAVYATLRERAGQAIASGHTVIVDAVFARSRERQAIAHVATTLNVPFSAVWLEAPAAVLFERVATRTHDASDADRDVVRQQLADSIPELSWTRIDAVPPVAEVTASVRAALAPLQLQP
jgi:predicted kinase